MTCLYGLDRAPKRQAPKQELIFVFWVLSLLPLVGLGKVGSNSNYWIELAAATSVLATAGTWSRLGHHGVHTSPSSARVPILLLGMNAVLVTPLIGSFARHLPDMLELREARSYELAGVVERVRAEPGEVLANPLDVVVLAGRPILFEPYVFNILESQGTWDPSPIVGRICAG